MLNFQILSEGQSQVPFEHRPEVLDIPLVNSITEVNCQVVLSGKVHTTDALAVKIAEMLVCYNIDVLQSTSIAKLFALR